jgi:hypothetical protein
MSNSKDFESRKKAPMMSIEMRLAVSGKMVEAAKILKEAYYPALLNAEGDDFEETDLSEEIFDLSRRAWKVADTIMKLP